MVRGTRFVVRGYSAHRVPRTSNQPQHPKLNTQNFFKNDCDIFGKKVLIDRTHLLWRVFINP